LGLIQAPGLSFDRTVALLRKVLVDTEEMLSAGQAAIDSDNLHIDNIIDTIQDIRPKNFTTRLLQPVPSIYSSQTWSRVPDYISSATHRVRDIMTGWWGSLSDQNDVLLFVFEAALLFLALSVAAAYATRRLRRRRSKEDAQSFWRRTAVAGGIVLLCILPVVMPIAFLYGLVAQTHQLPDRVDWLLYSTAQSIIIILAVEDTVVRQPIVLERSWRYGPLKFDARLIGAKHLRRPLVHHILYHDRQRHSSTGTAAAAS
jgi:potassium-dependent mechanosensitive channel